METNVLASLVARVIRSGEPEKLDDSETQRFHRQFETDVSPQVEQMRAEKRRAYEEARYVTLR